jgi:hypothetical protein
MSFQKPLIFAVTGGILLAVSLFTLLLPSTAFAQCGGPETPISSCMTCHEKQAPVAERGKWHVIHAQKDICINCHGGNGTAEDKTLAHEGMTSHPLEDIYTDCHACHPGDYGARAAIFALTLGVTPGSCATPTPIPISNIPGKPPSGIIHIPTDLVGTTSSPQPFLVIGAWLLVLTLFLFCLGWLERHHIKS